MRVAAKDEANEISKLLKEDAARQIAAQRKAADNIEKLQRQIADEEKTLEEDRATSAKANTTQKPTPAILAQDAWLGQQEALPSLGWVAEVDELAVRKSVAALAKSIIGESEDLAKLDKEKVRSMWRSFDALWSNATHETEVLTSAALSAAHEARRAAEHTACVDNQTGDEDGATVSEQKSQALLHAAEKGNKEFDEVTENVFHQVRKGLELVEKEIEGVASERESQLTHQVRKLEKRAYQAEKDAKRDNKKEAKYPTTSAARLAVLGQQGARVFQGVLLMLIGLAFLTFFLAVAVPQRLWLLRASWSAATRNTAVRLPPALG